MMATDGTFTTRPGRDVNPAGDPDGVGHSRTAGQAHPGDTPAGDQRGLPWWAAVGFAAGVSMAAAVFDLRVYHALGIPFTVAYVVGCAGAVLTVRQRSLFVPAAQPPVNLLLTVVIAVVAGVPGHSFGASTLLAIGAQLISTFPVMAGVTGVTVVLGAIRMLARPRHH
jgi:hypothetical protein